MERPGAPNDTPGQGSVDPPASCQEHGHHHGGALLQDNRGRDKLEAAARGSTGGKKAGSQGEDNKLGQSTNSQADECTQGNPSNSGMLTPGVQEVRQRLGSVRQMRGVPGKMEMGNGEWKSDGFFLQVAATTALGWFAGEPVAVPQCRNQLCSSTKGTEFQRSDSPPTKDEVKGTIDDSIGSRTWSADSRGPSRVRHGDGQRLRGRKRLTGNILKNVKVLEYEVHNVNNNLPNAKEIRNKVDIFEIFSGTAKPTEMAGKFGLKALQPMDKDDGYDLGCNKTRKLVEQGQREFQPLLMGMGIKKY